MQQRTVTDITFFNIMCKLTGVQDVFQSHFYNSIRHSFKWILFSVNWLIIPSANPGKAWSVFTLDTNDPGSYTGSPCKFHQMPIRKETHRQTSSTPLKPLNEGSGYMKYAGWAHQLFTLLQLQTWHHLSRTLLDIGGKWSFILNFIC